MAYIGIFKKHGGEKLNNLISYQNNHDFDRTWELGVVLDGVRLESP